MKELNKLDKVTTPDDWIKDALAIQGETEKKQDDKSNVVSIKKTLGGRRNLKTKISKSMMFIITAATLVMVFLATQAIIFMAAGKNSLEMTPEEETIANQSFVMYVCGSDQQDRQDETSRNDANLLVAVNPAEKKMSIVVVPRDAYVPITEDMITDCENTYGVTGSSEKYDKLTHFGNFGMKTASNVISSYMGINIDYVAKVNFSGLKDLVDAIGGITVNSDVEFTCGQDSSSTPYTFSVGENICDGDMALAFCKERQAFRDGDEQRVVNETAVLKAICEKVFSPSILYTYDDVMSVVSDMINTDMARETIVALAKGQANNLGEWTIDSYAVTGTIALADCDVFKLPRVTVTRLDKDSVAEATQMLKITSGQ